MMIARVQRFNLLLIVTLLYVDRTISASCPSQCKCRGKAAKCGPGLTSFPVGIDTTITAALAVSGTATQHNTIQSIYKKDLQSLIKLITLSIVNSEVRTIESGAFSGMANLRDLSLADNNLQSLSPDVFQGLSKLRTLDLSGNPGLLLDPSLFTHIAQLEELNVGSLGIEEFQTDIFSSLTKLKVLKLYSNRMEVFDPDIIKPLVNLQTLDLTDNQLKGLTYHLGPQLLKLKSLHLSKNPWQCNCQLLWFRKLPSYFVSSSLDSSDIICNGPDNLKYASAMTVPEKDFLCIPPKVVRCDSDAYTVDVSQNVMISCDFDGDPIPEIQWTHGSGFQIDGRKTTAGRYSIYKNGTLFISGAKKSDEGNWVVTAYNETSQDKHTVQMTVIGPTTTTQSTSTTTTTTTTRPTPKTVVTNQPNHKPISTIKVASGQTLSSMTGSTPTPAKQNTESKSGDVIKNGLNYGLIVAAFAAGGTLVGTCFIFVMCCKRKQYHEKNKIAAFEDDV